MSEKQTIPSESLYPPGEEPGKMNINELDLGFEGENVQQPNQDNPPQDNLSQDNPPQGDPPIANFASEDNRPPVTYFVGGSKETGIIEADLVSFREKGKETRFLSFVITKIEQKAGEEPKRYKLTMTLDSEEKFVQFKKFISNLNWGD